MNILKIYINFINEKIIKTVALPQAYICPGVVEDLLTSPKRGFPKYVCSDSTGVSIDKAAIAPRTCSASRSR